MSRKPLRGHERTDTDAIEILTEARTLLLENQWGRGSLKAVREGVTCYCVAGAVQKAGVERIYGMEWGDMPPPVQGALKALVLATGASLVWDTEYMVTQHNDKRIENRAGAVAWIDRAIQGLAEQR